MCEADTCTQQHDQRADIRRATTLSIRDRPPKTRRQALENKVRGDSKINEFDRDIEIFSDGGDGGEIDIRR